MLDHVDVHQDDIHHHDTHQHHMQPHMHYDERHIEMDKNKILKEAQAELQRHTWGTFVDRGVSVRWVGMESWCPVVRLTQADQYQRSKPTALS